MSKFILSQVEDTDSTLEVPLGLCRNALAARPVGHVDRPSTLIQLAAVHFARFEKRRDEVEGTLGEALLHEAMELSSAESHEKRVATFVLQLHTGRRVCPVTTDRRLSVEDSDSRSVNEDPWIFSVQLLGRFKRFGDIAVLQQAITLLEELVRSTSVWDHRYRGGLANLGVALSYRFIHLGELCDLEDAIFRMRDAVDLTPHGHPDKPAHLSNLGNSFKARFKRLGELSDLEQAISTFRDAVDLTPHGHPDKPHHLNHLGNSFFTRFQRIGELSDLEDAISRMRDVVDLTPHGHPDKPAHLSNLGNSFKARFERLGELSDLERAISTFRDAVELIPHGHPAKLACLNNLGMSSLIRFERLGELSDLEYAISTIKDVVELSPHGHPGHLGNLGNSIFARFMRLGELADLELAITTHRDAVDLTPDGHPDKPSRLNNLGMSFLTRFERLGELSDLEDAILRSRDAVDLTPHGHPNKPTCLYNLGNSLKSRFERLGELSDLEDAISRHRDAVELTPHDHPDRSRRLNSLGNSFVTRFEHLGELSDLEQAISLYLHAASAAIGPISARFHASQQWISCARRIHHHSLLHAYSISISLLPELAWIGLSLTRRYSELVRGADVVREAAAAALDLGLPEIAVEWLEQGRSIVWGELFQLRSSYEELSSAHPDHARKLRELSSALEHASAIHEKSLSACLELTQESLEPEADRHRMLAIERDKLVQEIRRFPGFEQFLLRKQFSQLRTSAHAGPVVILNAAESRCDALIVLADVDHVIHVPLPTFTYQRSAVLQKMLENLLGHARVTPSDDREGKSATRDCVSWESLLSNLWHNVVKPVLDALAISVRHARRLS